MKRVILCIMDGWGIAPPGPGNGITLADPPTFRLLNENYPHSQLEASGIAVGLPADVNGNTETGHLNIGAGRIVYQDLARINMSIAEGSFFSNPSLLSAINHAKTNNSALHLVGMIGASGVHSYNDHLYALIMMAAQQKIVKLYLHLFTDGRDSPPTNAISQVSSVESHLHRYLSTGKIASVMGRYYAMDRDMRLDRTKLAFNCLTRQGSSAPTAQEAIQACYDKGETDEFIRPIAIGQDIADSRIKANDAAIIFNFRIDRVRQITKTILDAKINNLTLVTMTKYHENFNVPIAFPDQVFVNTLGEIVARYGLLQLRCSESEKERFVTYYFNGQSEEPFIGEDRLIVPSPRVATYDQQPQMSTPALIKSFSDAFEKKQYSLGVLNIACPDMVAHTGNIEKTIQAIKAADDGLAKLVELAKLTDSYLLVTADHGNAEELLDPRSQVNTEHSAFPVPFIFFAKERPRGKLENGVLADIAPTIMSFLEVEKPPEMTGKNLYIE